MSNFKACLQRACKGIAKAWIKAVEPMKQSNHPYAGSDEKAPDWWPKRDGLDKIRHKEPDHLFKRGQSKLIWGWFTPFFPSYCASCMPNFVFPC
jgi:hypothetical protein